MVRMVRVLRIPEVVKNMSFETKLLLLLTVPIAIVMLIHYILTGFVIYNDGMSYYAYTRSLVIDRNLNFSNEWSFYNTSYSRFSSEPRGINAPTTQTPKGYPENIYPIGTSIMWAPFFLIAHTTSLLLASFEFPIKADGYNALYEIAVGLASLIYGFLGMLLIYKFCRRWFDRGTSLLATVGVWYGTAAFWYHAIEPSLAHVNSILLNTAFVYFWYTTLGKRTRLQWLLLGLLLGMIFLVRQQEVLIGLLPAFELAKSMLKADFDRAKTAMRTAANAATFGVGTLAALLPQMLVWKNMYGSYLVYTYTNISRIEPMLRWTFPQLIPFIFSAESGMWRVPLTLLSIVGVFLFAARVKGAMWYFFAIVAAGTIATSSWGGWVNGYGIRLLLGMSVFFALGAAELIERLKKRISMKWVCAAVVALIALNFLNMFLVLMKQVTSKTPITEIPRLLLQLIS